MDLKEPLQELGIRNIFTKEADLSAMTGQNTHHCTHTHMH
jgi:serine protease inhibitor